MIPICDHPENAADRGSVLVNPGARPGREIFRHGARYLATFDGLAFPGMFETEAAARAAQDAAAAAKESGE
jgi:hypothetical protein